MVVPTTSPESQTVLIDASTAPALTASPAARAAAAVPAPTVRTGGRDRWLRLYPTALGLGGLAGAWRRAVGFGAPVWPAVCLAVMCFGAGAA